MPNQKDILEVLRRKGFLEHQTFIKDMIDGDEDNSKLYYKFRIILNNYEELPEFLYEPSYSPERLKHKLSDENYEIVKEATEMYRYWVLRQCIKHDQMFPDEKLLNAPPPTT